MILLATLAGLAYGLAFQYGGLLASMLAHFGLNLCHILLFTYPLLASR
jgi:membrane protease YdiL (CAAX protease family)